MMMPRGRTHRARPDRLRVEDMRRHVDQLIAQLGDDIQVWRDARPSQARVLHDEDGSIFEMAIPRIRSGITYAIALHEFGHIRGRYQRSRREMVRETWAWQWARSNAIVWTPAMEREESTALASIEKRLWRACTSGGR